MFRRRLQLQKKENWSLKRKLETIVIGSKHVPWLISHLQQELLFMFPCTTPAVLLAVPQKQGAKHCRTGDAQVEVMRKGIAVALTAQEGLQKLRENSNTPSTIRPLPPRVTTSHRHTPDLLSPHWGNWKLKYSHNKSSTQKESDFLLQICSCMTQ